MTTSLGLTSLSLAALNNLKTGAVDTLSLTVDAAATFSIGQVLVYNTTEHNWEDFASHTAGNIYAVFADGHLDGTTPGEDTPATCIVKGKVNLDNLDSTAQADDDIVAALLGSGIIAQSAVAA